MNSTIRRTALCFIAIIFLAGNLTCSHKKPLAGNDSQTARIGLLQIVDDPLMAESRRGFIEAFDEGLPTLGREIDVEWANAEGSNLAIKPILLSFIDEPKDLIVTLGSPCLDRAVSMVVEIPVVFGVTINPMILGLNINKRSNYPNFTGTYSEPPLEELGELMRRLMPNLKTVGTVWNPSEINSRYEMYHLRKFCKKYGYVLKEARVRSVDQLEERTHLLLDYEPEAVVILADNTVLEGFDRIVPLIKKRRIPMFTDVPTIVKEGGADLGWGFDFFEWGKETGRVSLDVLSGKAPSEIPIREFSVHRLAIEVKSLSAMGVTVPQDLLDRADKVSE
ncbi:MAG: ABC transporter substrate-binding protein [Deltaproteobacteria bacterium]|nr:ABC transporter substrate-binding protein [Deltaproteobacteria bacterium]